MFNLYDRFSEYESEYVKILADRLGPKMHSLFIKYFGEDYKKRISQNDVIKQERKSFGSYLSLFKAMLRDNYKKYLTNPKAFATSYKTCNIECNLYDRFNEYEEEYVKYVTDKFRSTPKALIIKYFGENYKRKILYKDISKEDKGKLNSYFYGLKRKLNAYYDEYISSKQTLSTNETTLQHNYKNNQGVFNLFDIFSEYDSEYVKYMADTSGEKTRTMLIKYYGVDYAKKISKTDILKEERNKHYTYIWLFRKRLDNFYLLYQNNKQEFLSQLNPNRITKHNVVLFDLYDKFSEYDEEYIKYMADTSGEKTKSLLIKYFGEDYSNRIALKDVITDDKSKLSTILYVFRLKLAKHYARYENNRLEFLSLSNQKHAKSQNIVSLNLYDRFSEYDEEYVKHMADISGAKTKTLFIKYFGEDYSNRIALKDVIIDDKSKLISFLSIFKSKLSKNYARYENNRQEFLSQPYLKRIKKQSLVLFNLYDRFSKYEEEYIKYMAGMSGKKTKAMFIKYFGEDYSNRISFNDVMLADKTRLCNYLSKFKIVLKRDYFKYQNSKQEFLSCTNKKRTKKRRSLLQFNLYDRFSEYDSEYVKHMIDVSGEKTKTLFIKYFGEDYSNKISFDDVIIDDKPKLTNYLYSLKTKLSKNYARYENNKQEFLSQQYLNRIKKQSVVLFNIYDRFSEYDGEYVKYMIDVSGEKTKTLFIKYFGEDYSNRISFNDVITDDKNKLSKFLYSLKTKLSKNYSRYQNNKQEFLFPTKPKSIKNKRGLLFNLYDRFSEYDSEYVKYMADVSGAKTKALFIKYFGEDYTSRISFKDVIVDDKTQLNSFLYIFKTKLAKNYSRYQNNSQDFLSQPKPKHNKKQDNIKMLIRDKLKEFDKSYNYHYDIISILLATEFDSEELNDLDTLIPKLAYKIKSIYDMAVNPNNLIELKTIIENKYVVVNYDKIKSLNNGKEISDILLNSALPKYLHDKLPIKKIYAYILSSPHIIGYSVPLASIATSLDLSQAEVCEAALETIGVLKNEYLSVKDNMQAYLNSLGEQSYIYVKKQNS